MKYWLIKSEPSVFSFSHLKSAPQKTTSWGGVRNFQARNFIRDEMSPQDLVLFYHSSCTEVGVVGLAQIKSQAYPDPEAYDKKSKHYDPRSTKEKPLWFAIDLQFKKDFKKLVSLQEIKSTAALKNMKVVQKGQRLSIQPVSEKEFLQVCALGETTV